MTSVQCETEIDHYSHDGTSSDLEVGGEVTNTVTSVADGPFAKATHLSWRNVNMSLMSKSAEGGPERQILSDAYGSIASGSPLAIMGPTGAGKSSLLNVLAGRVASRGRMFVSADIRLDGRPIRPEQMDVRKHIAFVAQDDCLLATSTPREAIAFSAKLRLPKSTDDKTVKELVENMLEKLGLLSCADTIVGGPLLKGLSGGERKRTSVGVELVTNPFLIFLDEPTSGLDSFTARRLCHLLHETAQAGAMVVYTIHQPTPDIFHTFDNLMLMNRGKVMFHGPASDVGAFFDRCGHPMPSLCNVADWILEVASVTTMGQLEKDGFFDPILAKERLEKIDSVETSDPKASMLLKTTTIPTDNVSPQRPGWTVQIPILLWRELLNVQRDVRVAGTRLATTALLSMLIGCLFFGVGKDDSSDSNNLHSHLGAMTIVQIYALMGPANQALALFPQERPIFLREYGTNHYSVMSYFASRLLVEATLTGIQVFALVMITYWMVGFQSSFGSFFITTYTLAMASTAIVVSVSCATENPKLGLELMPVLMLPQYLFSGFFLIPSLIPTWMQWIQYLSPMSYTFRIGAIHEFGDGNCVGGYEAEMNCNALLNSIQANPNRVAQDWWILIALFIAFRSLGFWNLARKARKYY